MSLRGYFAIGIEGAKFEANVGSLLRTAHLLDAAFVFTIGARYSHQASDTMKTPRHLPLLHFATAADLKLAADPHADVVAVELHEDAEPIFSFEHPDRGLYVLGAEDHGLSADTLDHCDRMVQLPGRYSMNVASAGAIVLYDRWAKAAA